MGSREILDAGLSELRLRLDTAATASLLELATLVERWNQRINLSGHRTRDEILVRLVLDALALGCGLPDPLASLVDLGSGAGFPGLPLAIARPSTRVLLVESRERRHHFQRTAIRALQVPNAHAVRGRIEALEPEPAEAVVAQAVAPPSEVLAAMLPWIAPGGLAVIPGAETPPSPARHPSIEFVEVRRYQTPCGGPNRTIWIGRRRRDLA
jgi:16S rRNA (guanine527-N7)-methyltransferase